MSVSQWVGVGILAFLFLGPGGIILLAFIGRSMRHSACLHPRAQRAPISSWLCMACGHQHTLIAGRAGETAAELAERMERKG